MMLGIAVPASADAGLNMDSKHMTPFCVITCFPTASIHGHSSGYI